MTLSENVKLKTKMKNFYEYQIDPECIENKLVELEDCSRRCNLKVDGVKETSNKTWEKYDEHLETLFKDKPGIEENKIIERAQRTKPSTAVRMSKPRTKFLQNVKKLKGTNISINEDFSQETL